MTPRIGSLCSGYGGLDLGLMAVVGGSVAWHVEYDKHPSAVLDARFPGVPNYGDVTTTDWTQVEPVDWLTAGYPCQPFSHAGKRKGSSDERHLWPAVADAIGVFRPRRVLLENVAGHISLGLDAVLADLAALGYDATWGVVRAADAGAPHGRARIFIVAADADAAAQRRGWPEGKQRGMGSTGLLPAAAPDAGGGETRSGRPGSRDAGRLQSVVGGGTATTDTRGERRDGGSGVKGTRGASSERSKEGRDPGDRPASWGAYEPAIRRWEHVTGRDAPRPTEPGRTGERLSPRFVEWLMGLPAGWVTDVPIPRNAQLKALGNGVVPQQAALAITVLMQRAEVAA